MSGAQWKATTVNGLVFSLHDSEEANAYLECLEDWAYFHKHSVDFSTFSIYLLKEKLSEDRLVFSK